MHHYITKYVDDAGRLVVEAWIQVNLLGLCLCLSRRRVEMGPAPTWTDPATAG